MNQLLTKFGVIGTETGIRVRRKIRQVTSKNFPRRKITNKGTWLSLSEHTQAMRAAMIQWIGSVRILKVVSKKS